MHNPQRVEVANTHDDLFNDESSFELRYPFGVFHIFKHVLAFHKLCHYVNFVFGLDALFESYDHRVREE